MRHINQVFLILIMLLPITVYSDFNDLGHQAVQAGAFEQAIQYWEEALPQFDSTNQNTQYIDTAVHLALAYQTLGFSCRALGILKKAEFRAKNIGDQIRYANVLSHLGDIYIILGQWDEKSSNVTTCLEMAFGDQNNAKTALDEAERITRQMGSPPLLLANILNKQGNLWMARENLKNAFKENIKKYQECLPKKGKKPTPTDELAECPEFKESLEGIPIKDILSFHNLQCSEVLGVQTCLTKARQQEKFPHCIELIPFNQKIRFTHNALQCLAISEGIKKYQESLEFAERANDKVLTVKILLNLAQAQIKTDAYQNDYEKALSEIGRIQKEISVLPNSYEKAFALIQLALLGQNVQKPPQFSPKETSTEMGTLTEMIAFNLNEQSDFSRGVSIPIAMLSSVRASWIPPSSKQKNKFRLQNYHALIQAQKIAQSLKDNRIIAYVKGYLAQLYAEEQRYSEAIRLTQQAIFYAQPYETTQLTQQGIIYLHSYYAQRSLDILYRWEWQLGRLFNKNNQVEAAIDAYQNAVEHLKDIRQSTLEKGYHNLSQPFREREGQLYFELADLLLEKAAHSTDREKQDLLKQARNQIESFKLVELENYFKEECVTDVQKYEEIDKNLPPRTAVLYPILLTDRIELLLSVGKDIQQFTIDVRHGSLTQEINQFRKELEQAKESEKLQKKAQQIYQRLIKPIEETLSSNHVETLVIVPDGILRTIPFAALHDGKQYLIQRYAIVVVPGMKSVDPTHRFRRDNIDILAAGLSEKMPEEFLKLPYVKKELQSICNEIGGIFCEYMKLKSFCNKTGDIFCEYNIDNMFRNKILTQENAKPFGRGVGKILTEEEFTINTVARELRTWPYSIVHFATHGYFESDPNETYLLTYNGKMKIQDLRQLISIREYNYPLELLVLSACQTARGDDKAVLGLAGIALKTGVRSTLASLWSVSDAAIAKLMTTFYQHLKNPAFSKAQALQKAQQKLLQNPDWSHPSHWSAFLLIGNWL